MEMVLDKANFSSFLIWVQNGFIKQQRQLATTAIHLAPKLLLNIQYRGGSRSFAKEIRALKMRSAVASHWKLTMTNWESSSKLILLQLHEKFPKTSVLTILWLFGIWSKLERWKSSISGCLMSSLKIKKIVILKCHLLLLYATRNRESSGIVMCHKSGFYTKTGDD